MRSSSHTKATINTLRYRLLGLLSPACVPYARLLLTKQQKCLNAYLPVPKHQLCKVSMVLYRLCSPVMSLPDNRLLFDA